MVSANNVALLVNRNAKRVNERVLDRIGEWIPEQQVFPTGSEEESVEAIREILDHGYESVFAAGGDGTFMGMVNIMDRELDGRDWPRLGLLRLGTGNAVAHMVSSGVPEEDLRVFMTQEAQDDVPLSFVRDSDGVLSPFGGFGWDAQILQDYNAVKESLGDTVLGPVVKNLGGYFTAAFTRTIPNVVKNAMQGKDVQVKVTSVGDQAFRLGENGVVQEYIPAGETLFEGSLNVLMFGTTPYFGYGLKILPYAARYPSMFQIRLAHMHVLRTVPMLPSLWNGSYSGPLVSDFAVEKVRLNFDQPVPYQVGGDAGGMRTEMTLSVTAQPVRVIRLI